MNQRCQRGHLQHIFDNGLEINGRFPFNLMFDIASAGMDESYTIFTLGVFRTLRYAGQIAQNLLAVSSPTVLK